MARVRIWALRKSWYFWTNSDDILEYDLTIFVAKCDSDTVWICGNFKVSVNSFGGRAMPILIWMDEEIEKKVKICILCQSSRQKPQSVMGIPENHGTGYTKISLVWNMDITDWLIFINARTKWLVSDKNSIRENYGACLVECDSKIWSFITSSVCNGDQLLMKIFSCFCERFTIDRAR